MNCYNGNFEEALYFLNAIIKQLEPVFDESDAVMFDYNARWYYYRFSYVYAKQSDFEKSMKYLKKYADISLSKEKSPDSYHYKSKMLNMIEYRPWSVNYYKAAIMEVNDNLKEKWFKPLKDKPEFKEIEKKVHDILQQI